MPFINYASREINCKIVYYGPGLSGKTSNLDYIYKQVNPLDKGKLISQSTRNERTLFFDFLPLEVGKVKGFKVRFHLYTIPGQIFYEASLKMILKGVDGIVFVADSQMERINENIECLDTLTKNLRAQNYRIDEIPLVFQYNKIDLPNITPPAELRKILNARGLPDFEAIAINGRGVLETLKSIIKLVLRKLQQKHKELEK